MGEEIMARNNPFLGLSDQMFHRVKECESWCWQKTEKASKRPFQHKKLYTVFKASSFWCFKASVSGQ